MYFWPKHSLTEASTKMSGKDIPKKAYYCRLRQTDEQSFGKGLVRYKKRI